MITRRKPGAKAGKTGSGRGGARPGAGRKREVVPPEVMTRVGPLPPRDEPLQVAYWWQAFLGELAVYYANTGKCGELAVRQGKICGAAMRAMPLDTIREAILQIEQDKQKLKDDTLGPKEHNAGQSGALAVSRSAP